MSDFDFIMHSDTNYWIKSTLLMYITKKIDHTPYAKTITYHHLAQMWKRAEPILDNPWSHRASHSLQDRITTLFSSSTIPPPPLPPPPQKKRRLN